MDGEFWDVFAASRNAMLLADDDRRYIDVNDAAVELLGMPREQLCALRIDDIVADELREGLEAQWATFLERGNMTGRFRLSLPTGRDIEFQYSATANVLPGRHLSILLTPLDDASPDGAAPASERLTAREREVVRHVAEGKTTQEIAAKLYISSTTVDTHVRKAMLRLGAKNRAHLIALALQRREI
ncbi:MAG TPA: LuxR C-terminal-related transcriptional regulator [Solirubrobacteraceae bacterium]|jgi:PAS domain S-box-containing protein